MAQALGEDLVQPCELQDDSSSLGSDSELSGPGPYRQADRYGFIGGSSAEPGPGHPPADLIRQREMKWVEMTSHWEKTMSRRYKKIKMQCRKGIPSALRARCWPLLCGAHVCQKNNPGTYQVRGLAGAPPPRPWPFATLSLHICLLAHPQKLAEAPGDPQWMETIGRDLHRQFPLHEMFVSPQGHGQQGLLEVLKAYTLYRPEQGYCQAQGPVAAVLLMHLPPETPLVGLWATGSFWQDLPPPSPALHPGSWLPSHPTWCPGPSQCPFPQPCGPLRGPPRGGHSRPVPTLRRPSGAWFRSARSTSLATTGPTWRLCGWTPRCSWPCCGGCSRACTSTCSRWASGPCSTCPSGSCASSPAPCPSPRCCVSGMLSLVRV
uniref:TBC1 domain family member 10C n=1 Tax=Sus scrofa TaxID=9823 RepID=A0A8D1S1C8_PIG